MVFVEVFRLLLVIAGVVAGLQVGDRIGAQSLAPVIAVTLATLLTYVLGGIVGRLFDRGLRQAVRRLRDMPPAEVFAGSVVASTGLLLGLAFGLAVVPLTQSRVGYPLSALAAWVLCVGGARLGIAKGQDVAKAAGMGHLMDRRTAPERGAMVVETSALLDRQLLALGAAGLLGGGLVLPTFVLDEARSLSEGPDPSSARRARAGLEGLEALRRQSVSVWIDESEVPEMPTTAEKALALATRLRCRLVTCSADLAARAGETGVEAVNLRRLSADLAPHHPAGERLVVDLVRPGRQAHQAVGFLPDGDMVVVNDAEALVGHRQVPVVVSSSRPTSQGTLLFARLEEAAAAVAAG